MRITLIGCEQEVDLVSEVLCVVGNVSSVSTAPAERPGHVERCLMVDFLPEALLDQGLLLAP